MAKTDRTTLKSYFETGDRPTQGQFTDLIDSSMDIAASGQPAIQSTASLQAGSGMTLTQTGSVIKFDASVPQNLVGYFNGAVASIPSGWTEFTAARGRTIVGVPSGGTVGGTVGTALTDLEDRTHTHTGPSHSHSQNSGAQDTARSFSGAVAEMVSASTGNFRARAGTGVDTINDATTGVSAAGTGATGTAATSNVMAYVNQPAIVKS